MITLGAVLTTAWVVQFLFIVFCIAGIHWMSAKRQTGTARRGSLLKAAIIAGLAVAVVLSLALP
ncbi:hypothetical protein I5V32_03245 [Stenotrophomonas maltophilia]|uniref:hypothetical protein n=1 Tax=Stenotrophomonas TaxID=40323 RepID=UPI00066E4134|nr:MULTISPECIES: hypothetical protein [Stenotrophomonas]AWB77651.1 hypothetical protein B7H26_06720 [Stenotrophomonas maltophilia]KOO75972.1 hypothetical protein VL21_16745 [Stenotrophomonas maltophilia]MBH1583055.1 hypothetical protein [Stenotrophomonas maltophilia]MBH1715167.1 hypothetical protein [Stenotrophomonas maltophilia]MCR1817214.1 hypothetical protein [Stenotrophomonas muris]